MATQNLIQLLASGLRDLDGGILAGGKVWHYASGTTTKKAIYEDDAAAVESAQPIVLDSRGCAKVYGTGLYDLVVTDAAGATIESFNGLNAGDAPGSLTAEGLLALLKTVDGATSGLDADLLDGNHASTFLKAATYTAADVLAKLLTVDGAGSGLDADKLDGLSSAAFATAAQGAKADTAVQGASYTAADVLSKLITVDGAGSGIDSDKLDGVEGAGYSLASHAHAIDDLSDVTITTPSNGQMLVYSSGAWVNGAGGASVTKSVVYDSSTVPQASVEFDNSLNYSFMLLDAVGGFVGAPLLVYLPHAIELGYVRWWNRGGDKADRNYDAIVYVTQDGNNVTVNGSIMSLVLIK
jgi:hypothetical protein